MRRGDWQVTTRPDTSHYLIDLAGLVIAAVNEYLADEDVWAWVRAEVTANTCFRTATTTP